MSRELKYTYPVNCSTPEARKAFRRDARKAARNEGTYVPFKPNATLDPATKVERLKAQLAAAEAEAEMAAEIAEAVAEEQEAADKAAEALAARKADIAARLKAAHEAKAKA